MSEEEKQRLDEKVKASNLSFTEYLLRALADKPITAIDKGDEILAELKKQGNNLNQAVKYCHFGDYDQSAVLSAVAECKKAYRNLLAIIGGE